MEDVKIKYLAMNGRVHLRNSVNSDLRILWTCVWRVCLNGNCGGCCLVSFVLGYSTLTGSSEHDNEPYVSIQDGELIHRLLKKVSISWSLLISYHFSSPTWYQVLNFLLFKYFVQTRCSALTWNQIFLSNLSYQMCTRRAYRGRP